MGSARSCGPGEGHHPNRADDPGVEQGKRPRRSPVSVRPPHARSHLPLDRRVRRLTALALGSGALGFPLFGMLASLRAPGLGGTGAAKESLQWLAVPSSGLYGIGLLAVAVLAGRALFSKPHTDAS